MASYGTVEDPAPEDTTTDDATKQRRTRAFRSFTLMACCFSVNHACVTTVLAFASSELGTQLAGYTSGTLYLCYTFSALVGATGVVHYLGNKQALVCGTAAYCIYVLCFCVAALTRSGEFDTADECSWALAMFGAALGGVAAGWLWVAEAGYMTVSVRMYTGQRPLHDGVSLDGVGAGAHAQDTAVQQRLLGEDAQGEAGATERREAASLFASTFSTVYLGCEVSVKLLSYFLLRGNPSYGSAVILVCFSVLAVVSASGMCFLDDHAAFDSGKRPLPPWSGCRGDLGAIQLFFSDAKMPLMYPTQMAFGFLSSFLMLYVTDKVIKEYLGEASIGLLQGLISGVAAVLSLPTAWAAKRAGTFPVVFLGLVAFLLVTLTFVLFNARELGQWSVMIPLYVLYGYGRCVFESQNRAVMSDFFSQHGSEWGANIVVASGGASTIGFFLFPHLSHWQMAEVCLATTLVAMLGYAAAETLHRARPRRSA